MPFFPLLSVWMLVTTALIAVRWRGSFNGGSDFMTLVVLTGVAISAGFGNTPQAQTGCLWYIALQVCTSYFVAGFAKLKKGNWRSGRALQGFLGSTIYQPSSLLSAVTRRRGLLCFVSWVLIFFECSFPLALLNSRFSAVYLGLAVGFQLMNFYVFGLNRFVWAWGAAYPAIWALTRASVL
jgi:hypothetical protein